jgi:hypothetical protein
MSREARLDDACRSAISPRGGRHLDSIDPEALALLASGDLEALSDEERIAVWEAAAEDPQVARLVAELATGGIVMASQPAQTQRGSRVGLRLAFAACGLLAVGLLAWRIVEPPGSAAPAAPVEFMDADAAAANPVDAATSGGEWTSLELARDGVLLALLAATAILAWPALRDFDRPANRV